MSTTSLENNSFTLFFTGHRHYSIYALQASLQHVLQKKGHKFLERRGIQPRGRFAEAQKNPLLQLSDNASPNKLISRSSKGKSADNPAARGQAERSICDSLK